MNKTAQQQMHSCDKCDRILGDSFQEIKEKGHYLSERKTKQGLPWDIICSDCDKKNIHMGFPLIENPIKLGDIPFFSAIEKYECSRCGSNMFESERYKGLWECCRCSHKIDTSKKYILYQKL